MTDKNSFEASRREWPIEGSRKPAVVNAGKRKLKAKQTVVQTKPKFYYGSFHDILDPLS